MYGLAETIGSAKKRAFLFQPKLPLIFHLIFASMFFAGPFLGNKSVAVTNSDFYPVFLVVRSCGSASGMLIGWLFANRRYTPRQVISVLILTAGAAITTYGCYEAKSANSTSTDGSTPTNLFFFGLMLLFLNLLNDAGLNVLQEWVFDKHGKQHVGESIVVMSAIGTLLMLLVAGPDFVKFMTAWSTNPTWTTLPGLPQLSLPVELLFLIVNFVGNWNAKKMSTWLTANSSAVMSSLVPMLYRIISSVVATSLNKYLQVPIYTWGGILVVFMGSLSYMLAPKHPSATKNK